MTKQEAIEKLIILAQHELGYHETGTNQTKYARDARVIQACGWNSDGYAWCVTFIVWLFVTIFGVELGCKLLRCAVGSVPLGVENLAAMFPNSAKSATPEAGCPVCYSGMGHIGLCTETSPLKCIDGNYSNQVKFHWSPSSDAVLYLEPDWSVLEDAGESAEEESEAQTEDVSDPDTDIQAGDIVSIKRGAKFWNSSTALPAMWYSCNWIVLQVEASGRAVLDQKESGASGYMSPISVEYLTKVRSGSGAAASAATSSAAAESYGTGVQAAMAAKISAASSAEASTESGPVILNNTASTSHSYGGKQTNVQDR